MFIRVKKIGQYEYLYLVQSVREGGRHVQRVIRVYAAVEGSHAHAGIGLRGNTITKT